MTGPPVSRRHSTPTARRRRRRSASPARTASKSSALERIEDRPKGIYLGVRRQQRGKAAVDVLPDVLSAALRALPFPKMMRWDATLEDGRGELPFGRPIRWLVFPLRRTRGAVHDHARRQLRRAAWCRTCGRARSPTATGSLPPAAAPAARSRSRASTTTASAWRRISWCWSAASARAASDASWTSSRAAAADAWPPPWWGSRLLHEVPDLVEYPFVLSGHFAEEFLTLPEEVLTTTMIHHQHFFPVLSDDGKLLPVFLAVLNTEPERAGGRVAQPRARADGAAARRALLLGRRSQA